MNNDLKFNKPPIAFFAMEYGFDDEKIPFAGGLGILAADFLLEAGDQDLPLMAIGLRYGIEPLSDKFSPLMVDGKQLIIKLPILDEEISLKFWLRKFNNNVALILIDTNIPENNIKNQDLLKDLYAVNSEIFLRQQIILGLGGALLLRQLNIIPAIYHLNEGHTAMSALGILVNIAKSGNISIKDAYLFAKGKIVASKHTILSTSGIYLSKPDFEKYLGEYCRQNNILINDIFDIEEGSTSDGQFSTIRFLIKMAIRQNGVSKLHTVYEKKKYPESKLIPVTNGVFEKRWRATDWMNVGAVSPRIIKDTLRNRLVDLIKRETGQQLSPKKMTIVWARRIVKYKRPELLFSLPDRLLDILKNQNQPVQIIVAGKIREGDEFGQNTIKLITNFIKDNHLESQVVYIPNYNLELAHALVTGADLWVNTPERGMEACGTSGMKAGLNGTLQCSVSDGWVDEVDWKTAGWMLPDADTYKTAITLFDLLKDEIIPLFYDIQNKTAEVTSWESRMAKTIQIVSENYTAKRMIRDYLRDLYKLDY